MKIIGQIELRSRKSYSQTSRIQVASATGGLIPKNT